MSNVRPSNPSMVTEDKVRQDQVGLAAGGGHLREAQEGGDYERHRVRSG